MLVEIRRFKLVSIDHCTAGDNDVGRHATQGRMPQKVDVAVYQLLGDVKAQQISFYTGKRCAAFDGMEDIVFGQYWREWHDCTIIGRGVVSRTQRRSPLP